MTMFTSVRKVVAGRFRGFVIAMCWPVFVSAEPPERFVAPVLLPATEDARGELQQQPIEDCVVHTAIGIDMRPIGTVPCGSGSPLREPNRYFMWIEMDGLVSRDMTMIVGGGPVRFEQPPGFLVVVPGGHIVPSEQFTWSKGATFRVLSLERPGRPGFERRVHDRDEVQSGVMVPAGRVIAGVFDADGNAMTLSKPFTVLPRGRVVIDPYRTTAGGTVFTLLRRPADKHRAPFAAQLIGGPTRRAPDVVHDTGSYMFAVWYDVPPGKAVVAVDSTEVAGGPFDVPVRTGRVTTLRETLVSIE